MWGHIFLFLKWTKIAWLCPFKASNKSGGHFRWWLWNVRNIHEELFSFRFCFFFISLINSSYIILFSIPNGHTNIIGQGYIVEQY